MAFAMEASQQPRIPKISYGEDVRRYRALFGPDAPDGDRRAVYAELARRYYDVATAFYEFGWGPSFHFAPMREGESLDEALARYELRFADVLGFGPGGTVLDIGCGVGGPLLHLARRSGATIIGVNNNSKQLRRARQRARQAGLEDRCRFVEADFMRLPFPDGSVDAVYAIESIPHAPDKEALFREVRRVLRPGGGFAASDWCVTESFDPANRDHADLLDALQMGNGLPATSRSEEIPLALARAGFDVLECRDLARDPDEPVPWWSPLEGGGPRLVRWARDPRRRRAVRRAIGAMESLRLLPEGSVFVHEMLDAGAQALVEAGRLGLFTPLLFLHARKPAFH